MRWVGQGTKSSGVVVVAAMAAMNGCIPQLSDLRSDAGPAQTGHVTVVRTDVPQALDAGRETTSDSLDAEPGRSLATWAMTDSAGTADVGSGSASGLGTRDVVASDAGQAEGSWPPASTSREPEQTCPPGTRPCVDCSPVTGSEADACLPCESGGYCAGGNADFVACEPGTWDDDRLPATPCSLMTDCVPGQYVSSSGDAFTNRSCNTCSAGTFAALVNSPQCQPWRTCAAPTSFELAAPDVTHDRQCDDCPAQSFSLEDNAATCIGPVYEMSGGQVVFEAEHYHAVVNGDTDAWSVLELAEVSGGQCLEIGPDDKSDWTVDPFETAPRLDYFVQFDSVGTFYIHVRGDAGASSEGYSDSCYAAIDGTTTDWYRFEIQGGTWGWISQSLDVATTGLHLVSIMAREDGFRVDKVVVSTDATLPVADGPEESPRGPMTP